MRLSVSDGLDSKFIPWPRVLSRIWEFAIYRYFRCTFDIYDIFNIFNTFNIIYDIFDIFNIFDIFDIYDIFDKIVKLGNVEDIVNIESASKISNISQIPRSWICMLASGLLLSKERLSAHGVHR